MQFLQHGTAGHVFEFPFKCCPVPHGAQLAGYCPAGVLRWRSNEVVDCLQVLLAELAALDWDRY